MSERRPIQLVEETPDTVTLRRGDFQALLDELEDAEDSITVLQHDLEVAKGDHTPVLTADELKRLLSGESRVKVWRQKMGLTQRQLAEATGISQSHLAEIETGIKTGRIDTLKKIARELKVNLNALTD